MFQMRHRSILLPFACAFAAMAISACGSSSNHSSAYGGSSGSSNVSAATYVKSVCTALGPAIQDIKAKQGALAALATSNDPAQVKTGLQDFISTAASDLGGAIPKLQAAGTPNISGGSTIQSALVTAFTQLKSALDAASTQAGSLPTNDPNAFKSGAATLGATLQSSLAGIQSGLAGLKAPQLAAAAKAEPACTSLKT
jgi:hypothetical protein